MKITLAKSAGFCFGVDRAVTLVYRLLEEGKRVCTLGPIIHNPHVVNDLSEKGVKIVSAPGEVEPGYTLVIRSHGVGKERIAEIERLQIPYVNATCPYVGKIHKIVGETPEDGLVLIAGDENHPEIIGIRGHSRAPSFVFRSAEELADAVEKHPEWNEKEVFLVSQTTFHVNEWEKCMKIIKKVYTNAVVFDTICKATEKRQQEAELLSKECDAMIVVGGKESSNTAKLVEVCRANCPNTFPVESASELPVDRLRAARSVGVTAGASTPAGIIKEVLDSMSEITTPVEGTAAETTAEKTETVVNTEGVNDAAAAGKDNVEEVPAKSFDEMTFEEALEESLKNFNTDQKVRGVVLGIGPTEIQVDIGRKHAGFVPLNELTLDPSQKPSDIVKVGDELDLIVMKTNDQDGTVMLSKLRCDAQKGWEDIVKAEEENAILDGKVVDVVRGGVIVATESNARVFIPASQAAATRVEDLKTLLKQQVKFRIIDMNRQRHRAVGSIRAVARELRKAQEAEFWANVEEGKQYTGVVKSLTSYGAFVDLGGVDGMVHISELSWSRIKHPSEVVNVGDTVDVYVKAIDREKKKISLGYKKAEDNPWAIFMQKYNVGDVASVKIVSTTTFGAFAQIIPGVDGLIHISQLANRHVAKPEEVVSVGDVVDAKIIQIEEDKKRVSLSIRELLSDDEELSADESAVEEETPAE